MTQKEDENLEYLVERFVYNIKREKMDSLDEETLKALLLKAIRDERIDLLNLTGKGDIYQLPLWIYVYIFQGVKHELEKVLGTLSYQEIINLQLGQSIGQN